MDDMDDDDDYNSRGGGGRPWRLFAIEYTNRIHGSQGGKTWGINITSPEK